MTDDSIEKQHVVEIENVSLRTDRGGLVFRDLNLTIDSGQTVIVSGASGSGKTLLAELLVGLRSVESGRVRLFGHEVRRRRKRILRRIRRQIGGVGGPFGLLPLLTVAENITLPLVLVGERRKLQQERLLRMLSEFSLLKLAGKYPPNLTRVESSLVQFARASIASQPLMIIDEPLAGLDPSTYCRVTEYLIKVAVSGRSLLILVSDLPSTNIPDAISLRLEDGELV
ncbi:MAG: hypothetical protein DRP45_00465 [Candidatus Zixiibacteriota bacterium]|nr:MAG: hypothetical protein DRP45_00465 [candidate division Zixibacteria bacterium]